MEQTLCGFAGKPSLMRRCTAFPKPAFPEGELAHGHCPFGWQVNHPAMCHPQGEPRDFLDVACVHRNSSSFGSLCWAWLKMIHAAGERSVITRGFEIKLTWN